MNYVKYYHNLRQSKILKRRLTLDDLNAILTRTKKSRSIQRWKEDILYLLYEVSELRRENERLTAAVAAWKASARKHRGNESRKQAHLIKAAADLDRLEAENERLREALVPFAKAATDWDLLSHKDGGFGAEDIVPLRMEPYRAAREALK